jgi:hypothetical protein
MHRVNPLIGVLFRGLIDKHLKAAAMIKELEDQQVNNSLVRETLRERLKSPSH